MAMMPWMHGLRPGLSVGEQLMSLCTRAADATPTVLGSYKMLRPSVT